MERRNDAHLAYYAKYESNPDSTDLIGLNAIANQCPLLGGHAVYRARALLTVFTGQQVDYQDSLTCAQGQAFYAPYPSGQASQVLSDRVLIYPNPASDQVHLSWAIPVAQTSTLRVTDLLGRLMLQVKIQPGQVSHVLPVSSLQNGLYWFQIELDGSRSLQQVMINR